jgi:type VI secretion system protein ImpI
MGLTLKIENFPSLPDGGPLTYSIQGKRGLDIGRDQYLDWTLPDPTRYISGKHCEVRWHDGGYWLHDVSTNGTFLDGADSRLKQPHRLRNGDRFLIGHYVIAATIDGEDADAGRAAASAAGVAPSYQNLWDAVDEAAPPIDARELKPPQSRKPVRPDFLDWKIDVPDAYSAAASPPPPSPSRPPRDPSPWDEAPAAVTEDMAWAQSTPEPPPPVPEVAPVPQPRRPVWVSSEPEAPWAAKPQAPAPTQPASPPPASPRPADGVEANVIAAAGAFAMAASGRPAPAIAADSAAMADFVRLFARGAGLPEGALATRNPAEFAEQLGELMRLVADNMRQLLEARQAAKRLSRSSNQTMIQALNNNPLKFSTSTEEALARMLGPQMKSYLDARHALAQSFEDLKSHQIKTFSAMQQALRLTLGEFDPDVIENALTADRGFAAVVGSRKARLWDIYVARWRARTQNHADGMLKAFMDYFADCYDREES